MNSIEWAGLLTEIELNRRVQRLRDLPMPIIWRGPNGDQFVRMSEESDWIPVQHQPDRESFKYDPRTVEGRYERTYRVNPFWGEAVRAGVRRFVRSFYGDFGGRPGGVERTYGYGGRLAWFAGLIKKPLPSSRGI